MRFTILSLYLLFLNLSINAQTYLEGKVIADSLENYQINIVNITNKLGTTTRKDGSFKLQAEANDSVVFSSVKHEFTYIIVQDSDLKSSIKVPLTVAINELPEVVLNPYNLTGDINKDIANIKVNHIDQTNFGFSKPRRLNDVEREVYAMQTTGAIGLLIMQLNGQMASLKRRIKFNEERQNQAKILPHITDTLMLNFFKLDLAYKEDFAYFCAGDPELLKKIGGDQLELLEAIKAKVPLYISSNYDLNSTDEKP